MTTNPSGDAWTAVSTTRARSSRLSVWYSPRLPLGTTPWQPFSASQATWAAYSSKSGWSSPRPSGRMGSAVATRIPCQGFDGAVMSACSSGLCASLDAVQCYMPLYAPTRPSGDSWSGSRAVTDEIRPVDPVRGAKRARSSYASSVPGPAVPVPTAGDVKPDSGSPDPSPASTDIGTVRASAAPRSAMASPIRPAVTSSQRQTTVSRVSQPCQPAGTSNASCIALA